MPLVVHAPRPTTVVLPLAVVMFVPVGVQYVLLSTEPSNVSENCWKSPVVVPLLPTANVPMEYILVPVAMTLPAKYEFPETAKVEAGVVVPIPTLPPSVARYTELVAVN